jgi:hypothetical protein
MGFRVADKRAECSAMSQTFDGAAMTNGTPPPEVKALRADKTGPLCPGESVTFEATTSPLDAIVTWTISINKGAPETVQGNENKLEISGASGQSIVATASLTNHFPSDPIAWKTADLEITVSPGPNNGRYVITEEPRMPVITATASFQGGPGTVSGWDVLVSFAADDCPPFGPDHLKTVFSVSQPGGNATDFSGSVVRGGDIIFSATGTVNGCMVSANGGAGLVGTNPQQTKIQDRLGNGALQRIACRESGQRQFNAAPNGGTAYCPLFGPGGKVGIMQIENPTDDEVWNWQTNVDKGIAIFNARVAAARAYPDQVKESTKFQLLASQFNKKRQEQGLEPLNNIDLPAFKGDLDKNLDELAMDAIRGYDGWYNRTRPGTVSGSIFMSIELL